MGEQEKKDQLFSMGIVGYLEKPYSIKGFARTIENLI
jgi:hypothetical protein